MLNGHDHFTLTAEVNPPELPGTDHLGLQGTWEHVLVTDNVFGKIRVSPYAYGARLTHDLPGCDPTVVVSTRDRNILAIESEVRGAITNGVSSFLVVIGDSRPHVDHLADHEQITKHLRELQDRVPDRFEVGMPTRFRRSHLDARIDLGAQFFVAGPVVDAATVGPSLEALAREGGDPPVHIMVMPPFSPTWVDRAATIGAVPATDGLRSRVADLPKEDRRAFAWEHALETCAALEEHGAAGAVLVGISFDTLVREAAHRFLDPWKEAPHA
jgi:5,10-methylenetetrahydrofolate reductase